MTRLGANSGKGRLPALSASLFSAVLLALAMPGHFGWWPLLFFALVPLFSCMSRQPSSRCFLAGFLAGFLYHVSLLYWIVIVLDRYGGLPAWLAVLVMLMLAVYMGVYLGIFSVILSLVAGREKNRKSVAVRFMVLAPVLWVGLDWLRGRVFTGFPWMDLGYGLYGQPLLIQVADLGGHHLLTFTIVLVNTLLFFLLQRDRSGFQRSGPAGVRLAAAVCLLLLALSVYSVFRYRHLDSVIATGQRQRIAVVQGNIPQDEKWSPASKQATLEIYRQLSRKGIEELEAGIVVWPETALPFYPGNDPLFHTVTGFAREEGIWLLTGSPYFTVAEEPAASDQGLLYFNSALLIGPEGRLTGRYSKQHLVPFGEYVPLSRYLPFLEPVVVHVGNFTAGGTGKPLEFERIRAGVLICFESIFPGLARKQAAAGANLLVNLTNDAWYGRSSAPNHSFAMSILRSVETRRSLVRAANTGISGFVDPVGRVTGRSPLFEPLVLADDVPLLEMRSPYTRYGYLFGPACLLLAPFLFFMLRVRR
jgi:apolipoprotein N-acyltransferase